MKHFKGGASYKRSGTSAINYAWHKEAQKARTIQTGARGSEEEATGAPKPKQPHLSYTRVWVQLN
jgi:hypothetical protein